MKCRVHTATMLWTLSSKFSNGLTNVVHYMCDKTARGTLNQIYEKNDEICFNIRQRNWIIQQICNFKISWRLNWRHFNISQATNRVYSEQKTKSQSRKVKYFPINIIIITDDKNTFAEMCFVWLLQNKGEATIQWSQGTIDYITNCGGNQETRFKAQIIWCIAGVR